MLMMTSTMMIALVLMLMVMTRYVSDRGRDDGCEGGEGDDEVMMTTMTIVLPGSTEHQKTQPRQDASLPGPGGNRLKGS
eukprot:8773928-Pyramimonas_sp.AAC.1